MTHRALEGGKMVEGTRRSPHCPAILATETGPGEESKMVPSDTPQGFLRFEEILQA